MSALPRLPRLPRLPLLTRLPLPSVHHRLVPPQRNLRGPMIERSECYSATQNSELRDLATRLTGMAREPPATLRLAVIFAIRYAELVVSSHHVSASLSFERRIPADAWRSLGAGSLSLFKRPYHPTVNMATLHSESLRVIAIPLNRAPSAILSLYARFYCARSKGEA